MQSSLKPVIWTIVVGFIVLLLFGFYSLGQAPKQSDIDDAISNIPQPVIDVPTAAEIANEFRGGAGTSSGDSGTSKALEGIFSDEYDELEADCTSELFDEFDDDVVGEVRDLIEDDINDDIEDVSIEDYNYRNDYDFDVVNLGLEDENDREATVYSVLRVQYHETFGDDDWHFEKVEANAVCADWDDRDNEFDTLEVDYALA